MALTEWSLLVESRRQMPEELGSHYALAKARLCRRCPFPLAEQEVVIHLIRGLSRPEQVSAMMTAQPATVDGFIETVLRTPGPPVHGNNAAHFARSDSTRSPGTPNPAESLIYRRGVSHQGPRESNRPEQAVPSCLQ